MVILVAETLACREHAEAVNIGIDTHLLTVARLSALPTILQFLANLNLPISTDFLHDPIELHY